MRAAALLAFLAALVWAPSIALAATPSPSPTSAAPRAGDPPSPPPADGAPSTKAPATVAPAAPVATDGGSAGPVETAAAQPAGDPPPSAGSAGPAKAGRSHRPGSDSVTPVAAPAGRSLSPASSPAAGLVDDVGPATTDDLVSVLALMLGVATAALLGTGWLVTVHDRPKQHEPPTAARVAERGRRTAALRLPDDDPVLAALGLREREGPRGDAPRRTRGPRDWPPAGPPRH